MFLPFIPQQLINKTTCLLTTYITPDCITRSEIMEWKIEGMVLIWVLCQNKMYFYSG